MITEEQLDKFSNYMSDEQLAERESALRNAVETKEDFVCDMLTETNLWDFLQYEVFKGDSAKMYEALADYYNQDYDDYCDAIVSSWFNEEIVDK